ncbi:arsenic resistance transcriptional regulator ArsR2 [Microbulbifer aestuariivivens]|uniref:Arsenic resistance transcriptional regulator ArsR2 n=1 Tax=Microbulbifer aestuariivivens TaxID=1908308 RepID=A0ABP9WKD8_9GAMM
MEPIELYKHLGEETRLRILMLVAAEGELCVCELTAALAESQPKVSRHLALLRAAELLDDERRGKWVFYRLASGLDDWARSVLAATLESASNTFAHDRQRLARMGARPERARLCSNTRFG